MFSEMLLLHSETSTISSGHMMTEDTMQARIMKRKQSGIHHTTVKIGVSTGSCHEDNTETFLRSQAIHVQHSMSNQMKSLGKHTS